MTRVALIQSRFPAGGAERITIDIARYLRQVGGYEVFVYADRISDSLMTDELKDIMTIRDIPSQAIPAYRASAVEDLIVNDGIHVLVQVGKSLKGIEGIRERTGCKTVIACHGEPFWQRHSITFRRQKGLIRKMIWNLYNKKRYEDGTLAMRKAIERPRKEYVVNDAFTVLCEPYKNQVADVLGLDAVKSQIYPIENPESPVDDVCWEKDKVVMFCGRFENWSKRIDRLLRIWQKTQDRLPQWQLQLVGDGADGKMLQGIVNKDGTLYYFENGVGVEKGLIELDGDYYFVTDYHKVAVSRRLYLTAAAINGLTLPDGTELLPGYYQFGADGKMILG